MTRSKAQTNSAPTPQPTSKRSPGRPKLVRPKEQFTLRLDADVVEALRATGKGWQGRINEMLRAAVRPDNDED